MGHLLLPGNPPIEISLRRSTRARRISLRVSRLDGKVTLSLPQFTPEREGLAFAASKADWLRAILGARSAPQRAELGALIPVEGQLRRIIPGTGRAIRLGEETIEVPGDPDRVGVRLAAWLKVLARDRLATSCDRYARALGVSYGPLTLRDTRSRWGSCAIDGKLMFSWRLIMAPPDVLDYVAAHELAHRIEMNHSEAYWAVVARIYPGWKTQRGWLRREGQSLHLWDFGGR